MYTHYIIRPWNFCFKAFLFLLCLSINAGYGQNTLKKELDANTIETITIKGHQIFNISVTSTSTDRISIASTLDGEYQNNYQITTELNQDELILSLAFMDFESIPDDKRNAHKVIAAELSLQIPNDLNLNISSDIGSASITGNYNSLSIELLEGFCKIDAIAVTTRVNTIDGNIDVVTKNANIRANSKHGKVSIDDLKATSNPWDLNTINGNITVVEKE